MYIIPTYDFNCILKALEDQHVLKRHKDGVLTATVVIPPIKNNPKYPDFTEVVITTKKDNSYCFFIEETPCVFSWLSMISKTIIINYTSDNTIKQPKSNSFLFLDNIIKWGTAVVSSTQAILSAILPKELRAEYIKNNEVLHYSNNNILWPHTSTVAMFSLGSVLGDCGFGGVSGLSAYNVNNFITFENRNIKYKKACALATLFIIEMFLEQSSYIIFSAKHSPTFNDKHYPLSILFTISAFSGGKFAVCNPQHTDQTTTFFKNKVACRDHYVNVITHYTLMDYYQSASFKELQLCTPE